MLVVWEKPTSVVLELVHGYGKRTWFRVVDALCPARMMGVGGVPNEETWPLVAFDPCLESDGGRRGEGPST